jgi:hypothetical protein
MATISAFTNKSVNDYGEKQDQPRIFHGFTRMVLRLKAKR